MKEVKWALEASLSTAAVTKLERSFQPRHAPEPAAPEIQHRLTQLTKHATHGSKTNLLFFMQKGTQL
jgi:hypothetical protein